MGACDCADGFGIFQFPGPGGSIYTFDVHEGCEGCQTPAGIAIQLLSGDMRRYAEDLPLLPFHRLGEELSDFALPLIDPATIAASLIKQLGNPTIIDGDGERYSLSELLEEDGAVRRAIEENIRETMNAWLAERERRERELDEE